MPLPPRQRLSQIQRAASANASKPVQSQQPQRPAPAPPAPTPKVTQIPERLRGLEPADPPLITIEDPVFNTCDAATILGLKWDRLEKWRQRSMGPDYLRYPNGYVRYEFSALNEFKAQHRIRPSRGPRQGRRQEP